MSDEICVRWEIGEGKMLSGPSGLFVTRQRRPRLWHCICRGPCESQIHKAPKLPCRQRPFSSIVQSTETGIAGDTRPRSLPSPRLSNLLSP